MSPSTWNRPVPLIGDRTSAAERAEDVAAWAFPEPARQAFHDVVAARRDIREAAWRLFEERGYAAVSVEEIAASAGVSRTTAYRYFPNRDALLIAAHPEVGTESMLGDEASEDDQ